MRMVIRQIVTGVLAGEPGIASDGPARMFELPPGAPISVADVWGADYVPGMPGNGERPAYRNYFPGPAGFRVIVIEWQPGTAVSAEDRAEYLARRDGILIGYTEDSIAGSEPGQHATTTVDVGVVLEGELTLVVGDDTVTLAAGDWTVQNGTMHQWQNRTNRPCRAAFFVVGAASARQLIHTNTESAS
jgi:mannose-6-phosphate isomerase-like protein (cupin superfamily)